MKARNLKAVSGHSNNYTLTRRSWIDLAKRILGGKTSKDGRMQEERAGSLASSILGINWIKGRQSHISGAPFTSFLSNGQLKKVGRIQWKEAFYLSLVLLPTSMNSSPHNRYQHTTHHHPCFVHACFQHQFKLAAYLFTKRITILQSASPHTPLSQSRICWSLPNI